MSEISTLLVAEPRAILPPPHVSPKPTRLLVRFITFLLILIPLLGLIAAPFLVWGWGFSWIDLSLLLGMYLISALGITAGFHRLFTHRSFETFTWLKFPIAIAGSMAVEGSVLKWAAIHRRHHQHSDTPDDPHSPHHHGQGLLGVVRGLWYSHIGWFFDPDPPGLDDYVQDLRKSPTIRVASALWPLWLLLGLLIPAALGGLLKWSWLGVWTGLIWGGLVRLFLVHHVTWSINSACHLWGMRPYENKDESRNNFIFGVLALGEGWHHTHHTFPTSARHGLRWWQLDMTYYAIKTMKWLGLAWNVRKPSALAQAQALRLATPRAAETPM